MSTSKARLTGGKYDGSPLPGLVPHGGAGAQGSPQEAAQGSEDELQGASGNLPGHILVGAPVMATLEKMVYSVMATMSSKAAATTRAGMPAHARLSSCLARSRVLASCSICVVLVQWLCWERMVCSVMATMSSKEAAATTRAGMPAQM